MVRNAVSNINPVREDRAARVLVLVLNQQSATISLQSRGWLLPLGKDTLHKHFIVHILNILEFEVWYLYLLLIIKKHHYIQNKMIATLIEFVCAGIKVTIL